jgi:hypothetical protein
MLALLLLAFMALLAGGAARRESITFDEFAHTGAGVSYLQKLDMRMNEEHPPLAKVLAAVPLVLRGVHADYSHISWTFSAGLFRQYLGEWVFGHWLLVRWNNPQSTIWVARIPMLLLTLVLGYVIYALGMRLGGQWGGLLCLTAYVTTPAFLAFGPLVITDIAVTLFWVLTVWQLPNLWRQPSPGMIIRFALAFAGALLSKFSAGLLFFVFLAVAVSLRLRPLPEVPTVKLERRRWRWRFWWNLAKGTAWAALFVYIVYMVLSWKQPTDTFNLIHFPASPLLRRLLMPVFIYLRGLAGFALSAGSRPTFILGRSYPHGVWFYFPVIFLLKSQLAFLLLTVIASATAMHVRRRSDRDLPAVPGNMELHWRCLWVSVCVFVAACMLNRLDLSIRHFSIAIATIVLLLAPLPRMLAELRVRHVRFGLPATWAVVALSVASLFVAIRSYPNFIPFLNSLGFGKPAWRLMNDSNVDWNQALPDVEKWTREQKINRILLDDYSVGEPWPYVPEAQRWNCQQPSPGDGDRWAVLSANNITDARNCRWLLQYSPQPLAGGSMYAVRLPEGIPAPGDAGGPPLPRDYRYVGGGPGIDVRDVFYTCIRDPEQLEPIFQHFTATMEEYRKKK